MGLMVGMAAMLGVAPGGAHAQYEVLGAAERLVLRGFNICWDAEAGGDLEKLALGRGFAGAPQAVQPLFYYDAGDAVVFLTADFAPGADGVAEPACRVTVVRPQIDTPYNRARPILSEPKALLDEIVRFQTTNQGYRLVYLRQPHPRRSGRLRSLLVLHRGARAKMVYIEEGAKGYEFLYAHGARAVIDDPATADIGTDPVGRAGIQAFVDDRWEIAFCELNPHACVTDEQLRQMARAEADAARRARESRNWTLPFSGIGSTASGDNRSNEQKLRDKAWWENYNRCGRGKC
ncbi:MAG TPA: hypothetical protein PKD48_03045 [Sphingopyxis sp.]|nr:hypothetical protein [Sphingopyxis sp.]